AAKQYKVDDLSKVAEKIVKACGEDVNCYLKEIEKGENQNKKNQFAGLKAGYMIGVLGDAAARDKLVEGLAGIENGAITFVALQSIDHLAPEGAPEIITGLEELVEKNEKAGGSRKGANSMINTVIYRVSVRGS
ncbi:MAG: hypothetical protein MK135_01310, partial [Polyangiaceae bacterium]|nr:hypothetical protein [Polyangiaceae bacterium]